jgi:hypothetical protein
MERVAEVRTVLLRMNMTAVAHHAHFLFQNSIWPMSQMSRTSGWRRQNSHNTRDLQEGGGVRNQSVQEIEREISRVEHNCRDNNGQDQPKAIVSDETELTGY